MVQTTAVRAQSAALARAGTRMHRLWPHAVDSNAHSNRQLSRVEHGASDCKQRTGVQSTRHKDRNLDSSNGRGCPPQGMALRERAALHKLLRFGYSASPMLDLGFVREHMDAIE